MNYTYQSKNQVCINSWWLLPAKNEMQWPKLETISFLIFLIMFTLTMNPTRGGSEQWVEEVRRAGRKGVRPRAKPRAKKDLASLCRDSPFGRWKCARWWPSIRSLEGVPIWQWSCILSRGCSHSSTVSRREAFVSLSWDRSLANMKMY